MFSNGDKVVCINDKFHPAVAALYTALPKEGVTYVVREVRIGIEPITMKGDISILLIGLINPKAESKAALERGFSADRFRKLDELQDEAGRRQSETETQPDWQEQPQPAEVEPATQNLA
jgi:hypothetical protein